MGKHARAAVTGVYFTERIHLKCTTSGHFKMYHPWPRISEKSFKKVYLIVDNLKVHRSGPVKEWPEDHKKEIEVLYLPAYSPERNPDEYLNRDLKQKVSNMPPSRDRDQLKKQFILNMKQIQRLPERE